MTVKIITTNLAMIQIGTVDNFYYGMVDHQSFVIEADSWEAHVKEVKSGIFLPKNSLILDFKHDDFHLTVEYEGVFGRTKTLSYLIDR